MRQLRAIVLSNSRTFGPSIELRTPLSVLRTPLSVLPALPVAKAVVDTSAKADETKIDKIVEASEVET